MCVMCNQFASVYLTHLTEGHRICWRFIRSHSRVLCRADRHLHTYLYNGLRFAVDPCHPHHPFLASLTRSALFPSHTPRCASLPLPLLSCFKSSSFPLSMILPIPPLPCSPPFLFPPSLTFPALLLSPRVCLDERQVSPPDAKL